MQSPQIDPVATGTAASPTTPAPLSRRMKLVHLAMMVVLSTMMVSRINSANMLYDWDIWPIVACAIALGVLLGHASGTAASGRR
jgi:hypothetical protein